METKQWQKLGDLIKNTIINFHDTVGYLGQRETWR